MQGVIKLTTCIFSNWTRLS